MSTAKRMLSVITNPSQTTSYIQRDDCYPSCPAGRSCWGTSSGAIKFCITDGQNPNEGALPGNMMMTEQMSLVSVSMTPRDLCGWGCQRKLIKNPLHIFTDEYKNCQAQCDMDETVRQGGIWEPVATETQM